MEINAESQRDHMLHEPIPKLVVSLAIPTTISQLITTIYNTADTYFVAQIGTSAAAAVGVVFSLMSIIQALGFGLGMGSGSLISRRLGAGRNEDATRYASSAVTASCLGGMVIMLLGLLFTEPLMMRLGSTQTILPYAAAYARYILVGAPVMCMAFTMNGILRAEGEASYAMWGLCTGGILNMVLDPLFIFKFGMGISGAALATVISQFVSFSILLSIYLRGKSIVKLSLKYASRKVEDYTLIVTTGAPTFFRQGLASLASALMAISAAFYGDAAVAAVTIANKIYLMVRNIVIGIGQGFMPVAGYNYGGGRYRRVREAFSFSVFIGTVINVVAAVLLYVYAEAVITWFRNDDPEVIAIGIRAIRFVSMAMPFMAFSTYVNQIYQGLGLRLQATILASCRQGICFIPLVLILPRLLGLTGVILLQPGADILTFAVMVPFQIALNRKLKRLEKEYPAAN